jgi:lipopolysaccharide transport system ATP-binding protein
MKPAIRVDNLAKSYQLGPRHHDHYKTLRESLGAACVHAFRKLCSRLPFPSGANGVHHRQAVNTYWALKGLTFDVQAGEVVGIIGRNGAGKSTLLKILSQIVEPTAGRAEVRGRLGSLLEVGTGFHPELTGKENIFLNGSILGMTRREIQRKFDDIVAFSDIEQFLDTPVKRYSSGMYVRLAFAVAAYMNPDILVVDEVLAVGDAEFQRKCLGKIGEVARSGRTVLFVSHNLAAIESLCNRCILLDEGRIIEDGDVRKVLTVYHRRTSGPQPATVMLTNIESTERRHKALRSVTLLDSEGQPTNHLPVGGTFEISIEIEVPQRIERPAVGIGIDDRFCQRLLTVHSPLSRVVFPPLEEPCMITCRIPVFPLAPGEYWLKLALNDQHGTVDTIEQAMCFSVTDGDMFSEGRGFWRGVCVAPSEWSHVPLSDGKSERPKPNSESNSNVQNPSDENRNIFI